MIGDFPNLGSVWYNPQSIANILSLSEVRKVCRVTMDSNAEPSINVHRVNGSIMSFIEHPSGLYVYNPNSNEIVSAYTLLSTVADQKKMFSRREIEAADEARALYRKLGRPSDDDFIRLLSNNNIQNCPITPADAKRATIIYGPDIASLKGKTTRGSAAPRAPTFIAEQIPPPILEHHRDITLCIDFFSYRACPSCTPYREESVSAPHIPSLIDIAPPSSLGSEKPYNSTNPEVSLSATYIATTNSNAFAPTCSPLP